jgi:hypothetical protein
MTNDTNNTMFGMNPESEEFATIVDAATMYVGGRDTMIAMIEGAMPGSRTMLSDSLAVTVALSRAAMYMNQPKFANTIVRHFMTLAAPQRHMLSDDETAQVESLFLVSLIASDPAALAALGGADASQASKPSEAPDPTEEK